METPAALNLSVQSELARRHKTTATTVVWLLIAVILLCVLAFVSQKFLTLRVSPSLDIAVRMGILITLQRTTMRVAMIGILIAVLGFVATLATGITIYTYQAGVVAVAVLLYGYPVRSSWEQTVRRFAPENSPDSMQNAS